LLATNTNLTNIGTRYQLLRTDNYLATVHTPIRNADNNKSTVYRGSPTAKFMPYLGPESGRVAMYLVFKEMKWDYSGTNTKIHITTSSTSKLTLTPGINYEFIIDHQLSVPTYSPFVGRILTYIGDEKVYPTGTNFTHLLAEKTINLHGEIINEDDGSISSEWKIWNGTGWGDDNQFQIRDKVGVLTDDNENQVLYGQMSYKINRFIGGKLK